MNNQSILIIGAGPTGLMAANLLASFNIPVRIIDKKLEPISTSNALVVHVRSMEQLYVTGLADAFLEQSKHVPGINIHSDASLLVQTDMTDLPSQFPYVYCIPQNETEAILTKALSEKGVEIERGVEFISFEQQSDSVKVNLRNAQTGESETQEYAYVIACDGGQSSVREQLEIPFIGEREERHFIMMDCNLTGDQAPIDTLDVFFDSEGFMMTFPVGKDHSRIVFDVSGDPAYKDLKEAPAENFQALLDKHKAPFSFENPVWRTSFWTHHRQAKQYNKDRIFLAGDAAHVHSPAGGQGMNTCIQDVYNLIWKLAAAYHGQAKPEILESYNTERHPVGAALLKRTSLMTKMATLKNPIAKLLRNCLLRFLMKIPVIRMKNKMQMAMLDIVYHAGLGKDSGRMPDLRCEIDGKSQHLYDSLSSLKHTVLVNKLTLDEIDHPMFSYMHVGQDINLDADDLKSDLGLSLDQSWAIVIRPDQYIGVVLKDNAKAFDDYLAHFV